MALTEPQIKAVIIAKVGDDDKQTLAKIIDGLWLEFAEVDNLKLRALYTRRAAIEVMQAAERRKVDTDRDLDRSIDLSDIFSHLSTMYDQVSTEIKRAEMAYANALRGPLIGQITKQTPIPQPFITDESAALQDRLRRGDAYLRRFYPDWGV